VSAPVTPAPPRPAGALRLLGPYGRLFAVPGAGAFSAAGWLARLPLSTTGLGAVLLVAGESGSYGLAGAVSGALALSFALVSPLWARWTDRRGQRAVLRPAMAVYLLAGAAFVTAVVLGAPVWTWFVLAALTGATAQNVGSMVRARWVHALEDAGQRQTAFAFESVVDEVVFVVGPPLVTLLAALVSPPAGFLTGLLAGVCGGFVLARLRATEPPAHPRAGSRGAARAALLSPSLLAVAVPYLAVGTVFGAMDVVVVAYAQHQGAPAVAGVALAAYAGGSLVAGLVYGVLRLPGGLRARFLGCAVFFAVAAQGLLLVRSLPLLVVMAALAGLAIAPVLVSGLSVVEAGVERSSLTEALAWATTGLTAGVTLGSALAGAVVDAWGASRGFAVPAAGAALAAVLAAVGTLLTRTRRARVTAASG
jgi:MFS family permease